MKSLERTMFKFFFVPYTLCSFVVYIFIWENNILLIVAPV